MKNAMLPVSPVGIEDDSRPAGAPANEIEVTPEMIEAGREALLDSDYRSDNTVRSSDVAANIIFAALLYAGFSPKMF
jgi:hypothetical protein